MQWLISSTQWSFRSIVRVASRAAGAFVVFSLGSSVYTKYKLFQVGTWGPAHLLPPQINLLQLCSSQAQAHPPLCFSPDSVRSMSPCQQPFTWSWTLSSRRWWSDRAATLSAFLPVGCTSWSSNHSSRCPSECSLPEYAAAATAIDIEVAVLEG